MPLTAQQVIEKRYFDLFARHYVLPDGLIEYSDRPDVLVHGKKLLGVEIAHLHKADGSDPKSEQMQSIRRAQVIELAEQLYLSWGGRKIELWIDFDPQYPIMDIDKTASALAAIAMQISASTEGHTSYSAFDGTPELRFLTHNGIEYANSKWRPLQGHDVPALSLARVKELVLQKTEKAKKYQPCDAYRLLLIVEFWDPAQDQSIEWPAGERVGPTPFEQILIYKPQFKQVVEVIQ